MKRIGITTLVLLMGCGLADGPRVPPTSSQRAALALDDDSIIIGNGLHTTPLMRNALTGQPTTLKILSTSPLTVAVGAPQVVEALVDQAAQTTLSYLVECALKDSQTLVADGVPYTGKYGICPDWESLAPSQECLETISACLLARNNGLGARVQVSFRGEPNLPDPRRFTAGKRVPPHPWIYEPLPASLGACDPSVSPSGVTRNCEWRSEALRQCTPGASVLVGFGAQDPADCASPQRHGSMQAGADLMLRVCAGDHPCEFGDRALLATNDGVCGTIRPAVRFTCPAEGRFTVMAGPWYASYANGAVETGTLNADPIPEVDVFRVREGAFFGNLFDPRKLGVIVRPNKETKSNTLEVLVDPETGSKGFVAYRGMFSCADQQWSDSKAYQFERICAVTDGATLCAATPLGECPKVCAVDDGPLLRGDGDLQLCVDPAGNSYANSLTVFLQDRCALVSQAACKRKNW